jgi:hypothetical protein
MNLVCFNSPKTGLDVYAFFMFSSTAKVASKLKEAGQATNAMYSTDK